VNRALLARVFKRFCGLGGEPVDELAELGDSSGSEAKGGRKGKKGKLGKKGSARRDLGGWTARESFDRIGASTKQHHRLNISLSTYPSPARPRFDRFVLTTVGNISENGLESLGNLESRRCRRLRQHLPRRAQRACAAGAKAAFVSTL
jgi:hypothetical protein